MGRALVLALVVVSLSAAVASAAGSGDIQAAERYVAHHCNKGSGGTTRCGSPQSFHVNALYGDCGGGDGHDQRISFFHGSRFVGHDDKASSAAIIGLWRDGSTLAFLYLLYRPTDALAARPAEGPVRFRWKGGKVVRLDSLPPRTASKNRPGRYP